MKKIKIKLNNEEKKEFLNLNYNNKIIFLKNKIEHLLKDNYYYKENICNILKNIENNDVFLLKIYYRY